MPECPRISVLMRMHSIARTTSGANGSPTQTAWVTIRLRWSSACSDSCGLTASAPAPLRTRCAPSRRSALLPKPVDTP